METKVKAPKKITIKGVEWTPEYVKQQIIENDSALKKALLRIYSFQTAEEKLVEGTYETNGKGFNGTDAQILSSFAKQLEERNWLSPKQIAIARKKMVKYSRQIFTYIVENRKETYSKFGL